MRRLESSASDRHRGLGQGSARKRLRRPAQSTDTAHARMRPAGSAWAGRVAQVQVQLAGWVRGPSLAPRGLAGPLPPFTSVRLSVRAPLRPLCPRRMASVDRRGDPAVRGSERCRPTLLSKSLLFGIKNNKIFLSRKMAFAIARTHAPNMHVSTPTPWPAWSGWSAGWSAWRRQDLLAPGPRPIRRCRGQAAQAAQEVRACRGQRGQGSRTGGVATPRGQCWRAGGGTR